MEECREELTSAKGDQEVSWDSLFSFDAHCFSPRLEYKYSVLIID